MNNLFHENKRNALLLLGLLFLLLLVLYFLFLQPLSNDLKSTENQVNLAKSDVEILKVQIENAGQDASQGDDLERLRFASQMPMTPETEEIILVLEEMEQISGSRIDNVSFSHDGSIPERAAEETLETEVMDEHVEEAEPIIDMEKKPEKLYVMTINVDVSAPDYEKYLTFIKEIEKQERLMMVSSMNFQQPGEELLFEENPDGSITTNLDVTTFYYEE